MTSGSSSAAKLTLDDIRTGITEAIQVDGDKLRKKFNAKVCFIIDKETMEFDIRNNNNTPSSSDDINNNAADLIVETSLQTLQDIFEKSITPQKAVMKGLLKFKGKMALAMKLQIVLDTTRKYLHAIQKSRL